MDEKINEKTETVIDNLLTIAGASLLIYPLIKQATKSLAPDVERLMNDKEIKKALPLDISQEKPDYSKDKDDSEKEKEYKPYKDEIAELKRKLAEYESKQEEQKDEN